MVRWEGFIAAPRVRLGQTDRYRSLGKQDAADRENVRARRLEFLRRFICTRYCTVRRGFALFFRGRRGGDPA